MEELQPSRVGEVIRVSMDVQGIGAVGTIFVFHVRREVPESACEDCQYEMQEECRVEYHNVYFLSGQFVEEAPR